MGNFKIEIEAVGGHGYDRNAKQGEMIAFDGHPDEPDIAAKRFVDEFSKRNSVLTATLTHWPDSTPIVDDLLAGKRVTSDFFSTANAGTAAEPLLKHFTRDYNDLGINRTIQHLAFMVVATMPRSAERTVALRKLLEFKDAAMRAANER